MALASCLLRPAAPRAAAASCRCRLGSVLAASPGSCRWGSSLVGSGGAAAAAADHSSPSSSTSSGSSAGRGSTVLAAAVRDDLLKGVAAENREDVARIVEQAQRAADSWAVVHSDFYTPPVIADAMAVLQRMADVAAVPWGGYPQAERCRLSLGREEALAGAADNPAQLDSVAAVQCRGNFVSVWDAKGLLHRGAVAGCSSGLCSSRHSALPAIRLIHVLLMPVKPPQTPLPSNSPPLKLPLPQMFDPASHPDFLGACLGTGIERSKVGDIIVTGEQGCQILCAPQLVEHLEAELTQVVRASCQLRRLGWFEVLANCACHGAGHPSAVEQMQGTLPAGAAE